MITHQRALLVVEQLETRTVPATITVNTHADHFENHLRNDELSLREAIRLANGQLAKAALSENEAKQVNGEPAANQADNIHFNLTNPNNAIVLVQNLPSIIDQVTIDGFTQPGSAPNTAIFGQPRNAIYKIELDGKNTAGGGPIIAGGTGSLLRGLAIVGFPDTAVSITTDKNTIEDCSIGINRSGEAKGNRGAGGVAIADASENVVRNNVISGNDGPSTAGVFISLGKSKTNRIERNYIGTDSKGETAVPNSDSGVWIADGASSNIVGGTTGNLISGNKGSGVVILGPVATDNKVQGNLIGTDRTGTKALPNGAAGGGSLGITHGVYVRDSAANLLGGTTVALGNTISGNAGDGIRIEKVFSGSPNGNKVQGNYIGTDITGTVRLGNGGAGLWVDRANDTLIGGNASSKGVAPGNVISANAGSGVVVVGLDLLGTNNQVQGNLIGTDALGTATTFGNGGSGVLLNTAGGNTIGGAQAALGNVISGSTGAGIRISSGPGQNIVQNNYIGTDWLGTAAAANKNNGVFISGPNGNTIGGVGVGNVISGNTGTYPHGDGIFIQNGSNNVIQGNKIGTDHTGTKVLGNKGSGINIEDPGSKANTIGGANAGEGNVIGGNGVYGIWVDAADTSEVDGNFIGKYMGSAVPNGRGAKEEGTGTKWGAKKANEIASNTNGGVELAGTATIFQNNTVSSNGGDGITSMTGSATIIANIVSDNIGHGVVVASGTGTRITQNSIYNNVFNIDKGLGINLVGGVENSFFVTANDLGDPDLGPNNLQNYPVITSAIYDSTTQTLSVTSTLNSIASTTFTVEYFINDACDPSGYGEGQTFQFSEFVMTDASGNGTGGFGITPADPSVLGKYITATATHPDGSTSEFSQCMQVVSGGSPSSISGLSPSAGPSSGGTAVAISGRNFTGVHRVWFGSRPAAFTVNSPSLIVAIAPPGTPGAVDVRVITSAGATALTATSRFTYGSPLHVFGDPGGTDGGGLLNEPPLQKVVTTAIVEWSGRGTSFPGLSILESVRVQIADLPDRVLGLATDTTIWLDRDAAGFGWFMDPTPDEHSEFEAVSSSEEFRAPPESPAYGLVDLVTVVFHEMGHILGLDHDEHGVMAETLGPGIRRLPHGIHTDEWAHVLRDMNETPRDRVASLLTQPLPTPFGELPSALLVTAGSSQAGSDEVAPQTPLEWTRGSSLGLATVSQTPRASKPGLARDWEEFPGQRHDPLWPADDPWSLFAATAAADH